MSADSHNIQQEFTEIVRAVHGYVSHARDEGYTSAALRPSAADALDKLGSSSAAAELDTVAALGRIEKAVAECTKCALHRSRTNTVFGAGDPHARLVLVGEAPGREEDIQGEPFVGRAGKLLDRILAAIDLTRDDVYICNVLKCRPPENRNPRPDEIVCCMPYLERQIRLIRPKLVCALGGIAAQNLLDTTQGVGKLRGIFHDYRGMPLIVTYHPAALLRTAKYKRPVWEDMQKVRDALAGMG